MGRVSDSKMHFPPHDSERIWYNNTRDGEMCAAAIYGMCANLKGADETAKGATVKSHLSGNAIARRCNRRGVTIGDRSLKIGGMERRWPMPNPTARTPPLGYDSCMGIPSSNSIAAMTRIGLRSRRLGLRRRDSILRLKSRFRSAERSTTYRASSHRIRL